MQINEDSSSEYEDILSSEEENKKIVKANWTRVWSSDSVIQGEVKIFSLNEDLRRVKNQSKRFTADGKMTGKLIWTPKTFSAKNSDFDIEAVRLSKEKLREYGILAS